MTSAFYPEFQTYYAAEAVEWFASVARGAESDDA
jgi:hypothetical protein